MDRLPAYTNNGLPGPLVLKFGCQTAGTRHRLLTLRSGRRLTNAPRTSLQARVATQKYERPAQSALSECSPENRFYANQRRVEVDQINMNLAKTEDWRFCPSCHHMQNLAIEPDVYPTCPNCSDPMWSDGGQRRVWLLFRQAIAHSNGTDVPIDDSSEDREPKYYARQLMTDFKPASIREAWQVPTGGTPFGFEFISRVTFCDVNFGEWAKPASRTCPWSSAVKRARRATVPGSSSS